MAGFTLGAASLRAQAQGAGAFPAKPGKVIVGFAPGGATDIPKRRIEANWN